MTSSTLGGVVAGASGRDRGKPTSTSERWFPIEEGRGNEGGQGRGAHRSERVKRPCRVELVGDLPPLRKKEEEGCADMGL